MTIKEIAALAGVSISTVSKIMNHKDASISPETRERVLRIVKEFNYTPYSGVAASADPDPFASFIQETWATRATTIPVTKAHSARSRTSESS